MKILLRIEKVMETIVNNIDKIMIAIPIVIIVGFFACVVVLDNEETTTFTDANPNEWLDYTSSVWNVKFETAKSSIYAASNQGSIQADGDRYIVALYQDSESAKAQFEYREMKHEEVDSIEDTLDFLEVPEKKRPNLKESSVYEKRSEKDELDYLYVIYDMSKPNNLYVLEVYI